MQEAGEEEIRKGGSTSFPLEEAIRQLRLIVPISGTITLSGDAICPESHADSEILVTLVRRPSCQVGPMPGGIKLPGKERQDFADIGLGVGPAKLLPTARDNLEEAVQSE